MRTLPTALLVLLTFLRLHGQQAQVPHVPGQAMVMLRSGADVHELALAMQRVNGTASGVEVVTEVSPPLRVWLLRFDAEAVPHPVMLRALRAHPDVLLAQNNHLVPDRAIPDDPEYPFQWHHQNIGSEAAWDIATGGVTSTGDTIVVCIIERADLLHPDLIANRWLNHGEIPGNGVDDDGNGYIDDHRGWSPPTGTDDVYGGTHGTRVAGMAGATGNNALGVTGANWKVKLMVVDRGNITEANAVAAYTYPLTMRRLYNQSGGAQGAFVVATNASWGVDGGQPADAPIWCAVYDSLGAAGVLSCAATTNNNVNVDVVGDLPTGCPSAHLVSVTATNSADLRSGGYGPTTVDLGAPGISVRTTALGGGYINSSGTSFASPLTAGVVGLLYSAPCPALMDLVHSDPAAAALHVKQMLFEGVEPVGDLPGTVATDGRLNAGESMERLMLHCSSCPPPFNLNANATGLTSAVLAWSSIGGDAFDVRYRVAGTTVWTEVNGLAGSPLGLEGLASCTPYEAQVRMHCGPEESPWSQLLLWTSGGCCDAPGAAWATEITGVSATVAWPPVLAATTYELEWRPMASPDWTAVTGIAQASHVLTGLDTCTTHRVRTRSICAGQVSDWSVVTAFTTLECGPCVEAPVCPSAAANSNSEWIARVALGSLDNVTGNDGGYGDYTGMITDLGIGSTHAITLRPGYAFFNFSEYFRVWIDLDGDGDLSETSDLLFDPGTAVNTELNGTLTIPATAVPGIVRMRVAMRYLQPVPDGCTDGYDYGETEDYCVRLVPGSGLPDSAWHAGLSVWQEGGALMVRPPDGFPSSGATYVLLDPSGRCVHQQRAAAGTTVLPVSLLAQGAYFLQLRHPSGLQATARCFVAKVP